MYKTYLTQHFKSFMLQGDGKYYLFYSICYCTVRCSRHETKYVVKYVFRITEVQKNLLRIYLDIPQNLQKRKFPEVVWQRNVSYDLKLVSWLYVALCESFKKRKNNCLLYKQNYVTNMECILF